MKTFQEFLEEGKKNKSKKELKKKVKKIIKRVAKDIERQKEENPGQPTVAVFGDPNSKGPATPAEIGALIKWDSAGREQMKKRQSEET